MRTASQMWSSRRRSLLPLGLLLGAAALIAGCDERSNRPKPTAPEPIRPHMVVIEPVDSAWDTYSTDVAVRITGTYDGFEPDSASRAFGYQLTRTLGSNGVWNETITFGPITSAGVNPDAGDWQPNLSRIETNDQRSFYRLYDASGDLIVASLPDTAVPTGSAEAIPADPLPDTFSYRSASPARVRGPLPAPSATRVAPLSPSAAVPGPTDPRAWVDPFIVGAKARGRIRAALELQAGASRGRIRGLDRFVRQQDNMTIEVLLDPAIGAVAEVNVAKDGHLVSREINTYAPFEHGAAALVARRVEHGGPGSDRPTLVIESQYPNTKVGKGVRP